MDVFSRHLFAYPVTDRSATNTAKVNIETMAKHTYLPTTFVTHKGTALTSKLVTEVAQILGIQIKCATTKHPQTIGKLEGLLIRRQTSKWPLRTAGVRGIHVGH